jgi:hypothetical protein
MVGSRNKPPNCAISRWCLRECSRVHSHRRMLIAALHSAYLPLNYANNTQLMSRPAVPKPSATRSASQMTASSQPSPAVHLAGSKGGDLVKCCQSKKSRRCEPGEESWQHTHTRTIHPPKGRRLTCTGGARARSSRPPLIAPSKPVDASLRPLFRTRRSSGGGPVDATTLSLGCACIKLCS